MQRRELAPRLRGATHELDPARGETRAERTSLARAQAVLGDLLLAGVQTILVGAPAGSSLGGGAARAAARVLELRLLGAHCRQAIGEDADLLGPGTLPRRHDPEIQCFEAVLDPVVLLGPAGLAVERSHLALDLAQHILDAYEVVTRALHLALGRELAAAETRRARCFLDEQPDPLGLGRHPLLHAPLLAESVRP